MGDNETGQVSEDAAKIYEDVYLSALFKEWCPLVVKAANIQKGHRVVDVACGTGALAITVSDTIGTEGAVVGIDINEGMLNIARSKSPAVEWLNAPAEALPFDDDSFDCAVSQFGLMYFEDQESAIREMMRVLRPGGSLAVAVWDQLESNPGFAAEDKLWREVCGEEFGDESPNSLGDKIVLEELFESSSVSGVQITTHLGVAHFESIASWIHAGAKGWTADDAISDDQLKLLFKTAQDDLVNFRAADGTVAFPTSAHIVTARK